MARKRRFLLGALYIPCLATVAGFLLMYIYVSQYQKCWVGHQQHGKNFRKTHPRQEYQVSLAIWQMYITVFTYLEYKAAGISEKLP